MTTLWATVLAFIFPCLLYMHAIYRLFSAGTKRSKPLLLVPGFTFAIATLWLARSTQALMQGELSSELAAVQLNTGPYVFFVLVVMLEAPFWGAKLFRGRLDK